MWQPTSRDEQQQSLDMFVGAMNSTIRRRRGRESKAPRVSCPGDFPASRLSAELAADIVYGLEEPGEAKVSHEEIVGRLARAKKDGRRRRVLEAYVRTRLHSAAYTVHGLVTAVALGSQVLSPRAYVELQSQSEDGDWRDGYSYEGFLGEEARERAVARALPEAVAAVESFLDSLSADTGLYLVHEAVDALVAPFYYRSYVEEYITDLQAEGDLVLERAAALAGSHVKERLHELYRKLPEGEYRLVDLLKPEMLMSSEKIDRFYGHDFPTSLGEILKGLDSELAALERADEARWSAVVAERRKAASPRYKQLLAEELARDARGESGERAESPKSLLARGRKALGAGS